MVPNSCSRATTRSLLLQGALRVLYSRSMSCSTPPSIVALAGEPGNPPSRLLRSPGAPAAAAAADDDVVSAPVALLLPQAGAGRSRPLPPCSPALLSPGVTGWSNNDRELLPGSGYVAPAAAAKRLEAPIREVLLGEGAASAAWAAAIASSAAVCAGWAAAVELRALLARPRVAPGLQGSWYNLCVQGVGVGVGCGGEGGKGAGGMCE